MCSDNESASEDKQVKPLFLGKHLSADFDKTLVSRKKIKN